MTAKGNAIQQEEEVMKEHWFDILARERNMTVEEIRGMISAQIEKGWNSSEPKKRAQWRKIPCCGEIPTPDEWLQYTVERLQEEGQEDLLRWYPNL